MANDNQWCFTWLHTQPIDEATKAALLKSTKWPKNSIITVSFLDGEESVIDRVKAVAKEWTAPGMAKLRFDFKHDKNTDIRISFQHEGSWSTLGTQCRMRPAHLPTMNYGWLTKDSTDEDLRRVVLHEFGHALGMIHEHQNPNGGIPWNREQVIADLSGPPNNWDIDTIEHNMFEAYSSSQTNSTQTDTASIMMYPIPARWTNNGFSVGLNSDLSATDKAFIKAQY